MDVLVTAPFNKTNVQSEDFRFPGHTEYLQQAFGSDDVLMFMICEHLKVGVVTGHITLKDVPNALSTEVILSKLRVMHRSLKEDFWIPKPRNRKHVVKGKSVQ